MNADLQDVQRNSTFLNVLINGTSILNRPKQKQTNEQINKYTENTHVEKQKQKKTPTNNYAKLHYTSASNSSPGLHIRQRFNDTVDTVPPSVYVEDQPVSLVTAPISDPTFSPSQAVVKLRAVVSENKRSKRHQACLNKRPRDSTPVGVTCNFVWNSEVG